MTAIRSVDGLKYGVRLGVLFVVVLGVGGVLLALAAEVGEAAIIVDERSVSSIPRTDLAAGGVLAVLGLLTVFSGVFGVVHKLVADSVAVGMAEESTPASLEMTTADQSVTSGESPNSASQSQPDERERKPPAQPDRGGASSEPESDEQPSRSDTSENSEPTLGEMFDESDSAKRVKSPGESTERSSTAPDDSGGVTERTHETPKSTDDQPTEPRNEAREPKEGPREPTPEEIAFGTATEEDDDSTKPTDEESTTGVNSPSIDPLADPDEE